MKNKFKQFLLIALTTALLSSCLILTACSENSDNHNNDSSNSNNSAAQYIDLTFENYSYYLSINKTIEYNTTVAGGNLRFTLYKATVNGAINGLYQDCSLFYKIGDSDEYEVKLNAAGFATFEYLVSTRTGNFSFVRAKGKIFI